MSRQIRQIKIQSTFAILNVKELDSLFEITIV